jgi:hypothetical protein
VENGAEIGFALAEGSGEGQLALFFSLLEGLSPGLELATMLDPAPLEEK